MSMKNPKTKKKLRAVLMGAVLGAALFDLMILIENITYIMWRHGYLSDYWNEYSTGIDFLLAIPSAFVASTIGFHGGLINEYFVNAFLGAIVFAVITFVWQFILKGNHENKD